MSIDFIFVFVFFAAFQKINSKVWLHKIAINDKSTHIWSLFPF